MLTLNIEYVAGLFDGEGCVTISPKRGQYEMSVQMTMTGEGAFVVNQLQAEFGGSLSLVGAGRTRLDGRLMRSAYKWNLNGLKAQPFLRLLEPRVIVKREPVRIGLEFCALMDRRRNPLTDENREQRRQLYHRLRTINTPYYEPEPI